MPDCIASVWAQKCVFVDGIFVSALYNYYDNCYPPKATEAAKEKREAKKSNHNGKDKGNWGEIWEWCSCDPSP